MKKKIVINFSYVCYYDNQAEIYLDEGETPEDVIKELEEKGVVHVLYSGRKVIEGEAVCVDCEHFELKGDPVILDVKEEK